MGAACKQQIKSDIVTDVFQEPFIQMVLLYSEPKKY